MFTIEKKSTIIKFMQQEVDGYCLKYTLYEEEADPKEVFDMTGRASGGEEFFYSVRIETENLKNAKDYVETHLSKMTLEKEKGKELIQFLYDNEVTADTAYSIIDEINENLDL